MIKGSRLPGISRVALSAILPELAPVGVIFLVTGKALLWCPLEDIIDVASLTRHLGVRPSQRKCRLVVVKGRCLPMGGGVTLGAILSKLALVRVVFLMTGKALLGRIFENVVAVAGLTLDLDVRPGQRKVSLGVVKSGFFPGSRGVAGGAVLAVLPVVWVILLVTVVTFVRSGLDGGQGELALMAAGAIGFEVRSIQTKVGLVMVKGSAVSIHPIVTGQAGSAEGVDMGLRKSRIVVAVTIFADLLAKITQVLGVTRRAGKRVAIGQFLVSLQIITGGFGMGKTPRVNHGQVSRRSFVLGMALLAGRKYPFRQRAVQTGGGFQFR